MYLTERKYYGEVEYFKAIFKNRTKNNTDTEPFAIWRYKYVNPTNNVYKYANIHICKYRQNIQISLKEMRM